MYKLKRLVRFNFLPLFKEYCKGNTGKQLFENANKLCFATIILFGTNISLLIKKRSFLRSGCIRVRNSNNVSDSKHTNEIHRATIFPEKWIQIQNITNSCIERYQKCKP